MDPRFYYIAPFFTAALCVLLVAFYVWPKRRVIGGRALLVTCLAASLWSWCEGLLYFGFSLTTNVFITKIQYLGILPAVHASLVFVLQVFGPRSWLRPASIALLALAAASFIALAWSNDAHFWHWSAYHLLDQGAFPMLGLSKGPTYWLMVLWCYSILLAVSLVLLKQIFQGAAFYRGQALMVFLGFAVVWTANIVYVSGNSPVPNMDLGPLAFTLVAAAMAWGFFRYNLLEIMPVARDEVFNSLADAVLVVDSQNRVVDMNPAARNLLGAGLGQALGKDVYQAFPDNAQISAMLGGQDERPCNAVDSGQSHDLQVSALKDRRGRVLGRLLVWRDVSERNRLLRELETLATTDPLTGAANRRHFMQSADNEIKRAARYGHDLCFVMLDVDRFKAINDRYGHHAGDEVLRVLVAVCRSFLRETDIFGRLGGEEFGMLLVETRVDKARAIAGRLLRLLADWEVQVDKEAISFTVSLGISQWRPEETSVEPVMKRADQALYQAKEAGRNQVAVA